MQAGNTSRRAAFAALAALALVWGYNWVVMRIAVEYAPPFLFAGLRAFGGSIALFAVMLAMRKPLRPYRPWPVFWLGFFQTTGFIGIVTWAIVASGVGTIAILSYTMPVWVALLAWPLLGERLRAAHVAAVVIALVGILCILDPGRVRASLFADVLAVVAGISWAIGVIIAKRLQRDPRVDLLSLTTWQMFFGGLVLLAIALAVPHGTTRWTGAYVAALSYNIFAATALAYVLWLFVLRNLPARTAGMGTLANPLVGIVAAWIVLGERPSLLTGIGMLLVTAALALIAFTRGA